MHVVSGAVLERWVGLTDEDIVSRVLQGQTALFEVLMRRHNQRIYRACAGDYSRRQGSRRRDCSRPTSTRMRTCGSSMDPSTKSILHVG